MGCLDWLALPLYLLIYGPPQIWCWLRGVHYPSGTPLKQPPRKPVNLDFSELDPPV